MSSNASPSSSRQTPSRATRSLPKKSPATVSTPLPATGDFASPAVPRLRVGADSVNVNPEVLQAKYSGRKILARFKLQSNAPHPYPINLQEVHNSLEHTCMVGEALADKLADLDENPPTLADLRPRPIRATVAPPAPLPSPPVLPPLIPDSDAPHNPTDELDETTEEELTEFSRRWQARFDERKALRDNHRATCERVQREHEAAFWAKQDHILEFWESERTANLADLAAYNEERAWVMRELEFVGESRDRDLVRAGRHIVQQNEIEAVTRHIYHLRDFVAYSHEMLVALQGNQTLGKEINVFLEAAHLGEVPPGFSYRPIDTKTPYVNCPVSPSVPSLPPPASSSPSSSTTSRDQGKGKAKATDSAGKGKGRAVDSTGKGKGKAREVTGGTESSKLPKVTLRLPPPPADFASVRSGSSKKRTAVEDGASERPLKVKKSYDFSRRRTCNLRGGLIDFPILSSTHQPNTISASGTPSPALRDPEGCKISQAVRPVLQDWLSLLHGLREDASELRDLRCGEDEVASVFLVYQHAYASYFDLVRGHLDPAFAAPFDFDKWYPPHFDYRTRAEKRAGIPFLFSNTPSKAKSPHMGKVYPNSFGCGGKRQLRYCKSKALFNSYLDTFFPYGELLPYWGSAVDSVGSGDAKSEDEDEDDVEEEEEEDVEDAMEVDNAASANPGFSHS
ncbi:hypothetical protein C8F04DRAFT_1197761 [Mycena alexandri]|uniref:Uncharacterized protein n=1 Tax=Mycena alexandri TaxID=1745969 RepID=A0AAD6S1U6_9AGAR|nr:hypothetical protein C8F04DRAFT_1197761 [Mycena alexandri]